MKLIRWLVIVSICTAISISHGQEGSNPDERQLYAIEKMLDQGAFAQAERSALVLVKRLEGSGVKSEALLLATLQLVRSYRGSLQPQKAEIWARKLVALSETVLGKEHPNTLGAIAVLAELYRELNRYAEAEPLFKRALSLSEKVLGPQAPRTAGILNALALSYADAGRYGDAESLYKRALAIAEKNRDLSQIARIIDNEGSLRFQQGRLADAESLFKRSLAIREKVGGASDPDTGLSINNLAMAHAYQGNHAEATALYQRTIAINEAAYGRDHPKTALAINNLGTLYLSLGRLADAESLLQRALLIREKSLGPDHPDTADGLNNLAMVYKGQHRYEEAMPLLLRALAIKERVLGPEHPETISVLNNVGTMHRALGRYREAETLFKRSLAAREKALGPTHLSTADSLSSLAELYWYQKRYSDAESLFQRSLAIEENALGAEHMHTAKTISNLAAVYRAQGLDDKAKPLLRRSLAILASRHKKEPDGENIKHGPRDGLLLPYLRLLSRQKSLAAPQDQADALTSAQLARHSSTADAFADLAQRLAAGTSEEIAQHVRDRQELAKQLDAAEKRLVEAYSQPAGKRSGEPIEPLRREADRLRREYARATHDLSEKFPAFAEFEGNRLVDAGSLQKVMQPNEALLAWILGDNESYLLLIRPSGPPKVTVLATGESGVANEVRLLREALSLDGKDQLDDFPAARSAQLFQKLFGATWKQDLAGIDHLFLVPEGALTRLPFSVLLTTSPAEAIFAAEGHQYRQAPWLIRHFSISVLPSISALTALRTLEQSGKASSPFLGIGDPLLKDHPSLSGRTVAATTRTFRKPALAVLRSRGIDRAGLIRSQPSLPDTADELARMAHALGANEKTSLLLRDRATESAVKHAQLGKYAILSFATHGVLAGQMDSDSEAGLILTPPTNPSEEDDGYLTVTEVAKLRLNADWVILSACNTAGGDAEEAEGLSGLAKAFTYAGAKALFVSHWAVDSEATTKLTGYMFQAKRDKQLTRADAHRQAMLTLLQDSDANFSHPSLWAPFIVVGDGGR